MWACRAIALASVLLVTVQALFEDEVGQYEWIVQQVGQPTALAYSTDAADKVFVASGSGVVASMLLKDGSMQWRTVAASAARMKQLRAGSRGLLSVTDKGLVQFWKGSTGDLTWQRQYPDEVVDIHIVGPATKQNVVVVRSSEVEVRSTTGKHEWSSPAGAGARFWAAAPSENNVVCAVSAKPGGAGAQSVQIDIATGKILKTTPVPAAVAKALETSSFLVVDAQLVLLSSGAITVQPLCGEGKAETFEMRKIKSSGKVPFQLMPWQHTPGVFSATNGATTAIFGVNEKGLKHLRTFEGVAVVGPVHSIHDDETGQPVAVAIVGDEGTKIQLLDPASGNVQPAINAAGYTAKDHGPARLLLVRELSSGEHHTVISAADHSLVGMQGSKVNWVREEALTSIRQAVFYGRAGIHKSKNKVEDASLSSLLPALTAQLSQLPMYMGEVAQKPAQLLAALTEYASGLGREPKRSRPTLLANGKVPTAADELRGFGANKLILCMTGASKLFALEATTSEIVWQRYFANGAELLGDVSGKCMDSDANGGGKGKCGLWMQLLPSSSAVYSELIVMTPTPTDASQSAQMVHWVDPLTGKDVHAQKAPSTAGVASLMTFPGNTQAKLEPVQPFLLVDTEHKVHVLPSNDAKHAKLLEANSERLFHYEVNRASQVVQGFSIGKSGTGAELVRLWNIELGSIGERIVAATSPQHREWEHVPVHIKGDASILYKYMNTNMMAVATEDVGEGDKGTSLNLYILDAVTGHVLHQSRIVGGAGPVHMAACDNWVLAHYWNEKKTRFELTVVELFESKSDGGPWNILFGAGQAENFTTSAHHLESPVPLQQTYIFPAGVTSMGVTATMKGITPRSVIMALTTDHLYTITKDMLNPRRPYMVNGVVDKERGVPAQYATTKEEPVPPYAPVMPLRPTDVLTYYNPIGQVRGIVSSPTSLESTSLIFSYGLDLFFTPVQTAKAYDVLSPSFQYSLLYASVLIVFGALMFTSFLSSRQTLKDRWR